MRFITDITEDEDYEKDMIYTDKETQKNLHVYIIKYLAKVCISRF